MASTSFYNIIGILRQDMLERLTSLDVISSNITNINTPGFRSTRSNFQELLGGAEKGGGVIGSTQVSQKQGSITQTSWPLDLSIEGDGYFGMQLSDGRTAYTRDGRLTLDANGTIVNGSGHELVWDGVVPEGVTASKIVILENGSVGSHVTGQQVVTEEVLNEDGELVEQPVTYIEIDEDGNEVEIELTVPATEFEQFGTISLNRFTNASALERYGENLWLETENSGEAIVGAATDEFFGQIVSQSYEQSNVVLANELSHLISIQRGMQVSVRAFQQTDVMIQQAIHMRR